MTAKELSEKTENQIATMRMWETHVALMDKIDPDGAPDGGAARLRYHKACTELRRLRNEGTP